MNKNFNQYLYLITIMLVWLFIGLPLSACTITPTLQQKQNITAAGYNVQLGLAYLRQAKMPQAKAKFLKALQQAPNWPAAQEAMAYFLEITGDKQAAENYYLQAIKLAPSDGAALNNYGTFLCRVKRQQVAEKMFLLAIKNPNYLNSAAAYENAGLCALTLPNIAAAQYYFQKALQQEPTRVTVLLELAKIAYRQGNARLATTYLSRYKNLSD